MAVAEYELEPEIIDLIEAQVKRAHWPKVVARRLGIDAKTYDRWMARGEKARKDDCGYRPSDPEFLYRQLYERIEEAEAIAEIELLEMAREQAALGKTSWNAFIQTLERRFSDRWGRKDASLGTLNDSHEAQIKRFLAEQQADPEQPPEALHAVK